MMNSLPLAIFCGCAARFLLDLDGIPGERLSQDETQIQEQYKNEESKNYETSSCVT